MARASIYRSRVLGWAFAQAVLAAIWAIEDGKADQSRDAWIGLAGTLRPMIAPGRAVSARGIAAQESNLFWNE